MRDTDLATTSLDEAIQTNHAKSYIRELRRGSGRYYVSCPICRTRTRLTGRTTPTYHPAFPIREYCCPECGERFIYDVLRNFIVQYYDEKIFQQLV